MRRHLSRIFFSLFRLVRGEVGLMAGAYILVLAAIWMYSGNRAVAVDWAGGTMISGLTLFGMWRFPRHTYVYHSMFRVVFWWPPSPPRRLPSCLATCRFEPSCSRQPLRWFGALPVTPPPCGGQRIMYLAAQPLQLSRHFAGRRCWFSPRFGSCGASLAGGTLEFCLSRLLSCRGKVRLGIGAM